MLTMTAGPENRTRQTFVSALEIPGEGPATQKMQAGEGDPPPTIAQDCALSTPASSRFPEAGDEFLGFRLQALLGSGGIAKVYLAQQANLADRLVALKISAARNKEPQRLARLQHPNIMPILSVHYLEPFQAVCMPYLGSLTLNDVYERLFRERKAPSSGASIFGMETEKAIQSTMQAEGSSASLPEFIAVPPPVLDADYNSVTLRDELGKMNYVEAILKLVSKLADGLAYAHSRGVIHRDLKPANILLCADGQPMLLDFNLAIDSTETGKREIGGTILYMAPEQLRALVRRDNKGIDGRTDLYALGLICYEMLTGHPPYSACTREDGKKFDFAAMEQARRAAPAPMRGFNPEVPPSVEAIVAKLLAYDPAERYSCASELREDIDRQLQNRPLRHTKEPSLRVRFGKWKKRNPRALHWSAIAAVLCLAVGGLAVNERRHFAERRVAAEQLFQKSVGELDDARLDVQSNDLDKVRNAAINRCRNILHAYGVDENGEWKTKDSFRLLKEVDGDQLAERIGETLLLLAAHERQAGTPESLQKAMKDNLTAMGCFRDGKMPSFGWSQRGELAELLDNTPMKEEARKRLADAGSAEGNSAFLRGTAFLGLHRYADATACFTLVTDAHPRSYAGQFLLAYCLQRQQQYAPSKERYAIACSIRNDDFRLYFNRGLLNAAMGLPVAAGEDLRQAVRLKPEDGRIRYELAAALFRLGDLENAEAELTTAERLDHSPIQVASLRADLLGKTGHVKEAAALRERLPGLDAKSASDFIVRGNARAAADPKNAIADFRRAIQLNPLEPSAYEGLAAVHCDALKDVAGGIGCLDEALKLMPGQPFTRASRAVLLARAGRIADAQADAEKVLEGCNNSFLFYQIAGVYAIGSKANKADADKAVGLLRKAVAEGFGDFETMRDDADLENIRDTPAFREVLATATNLRGWGQLKPH